MVMFLFPYRMFSKLCILAVLLVAVLSVASASLYYRGFQRSFYTPYVGFGGPLYYGDNDGKLRLFEPCHEIMVLFVLRKRILQTRMHSHPVGLDVWFLVGHFVYFMCANSEGSGESARMRRLAWAFAGRLCDKYHNLVSWLIFCLLSYPTRFYAIFTGSGYIRLIRVDVRRPCAWRQGVIDKSRTEHFFIENVLILCTLFYFRKLIK